MPAWYHRAAWDALKVLYAPGIVEKYGVTAKGAELLPSPPFILVSDHSNAIDPYVIGSFSKWPIRYMANIEGVHPIKAAFAELVGAYGKRKGARDLGALRNTLALARKGEAIGIFPEGDRSWDGASAPPKPGVGRLARQFGLPLVLAMQRGNYLSKPRWARRSRRGSWSVEFEVIGENELARMSEGLAEALVAAALRKNEIKDAILRGQAFTGRGLAEGVERLLWRCPVCGKPDSIIGRGDVASCDACGARWLLDANCRVKPLNASLSIHLARIGDLKDWHDWQVSTLPELAASAPRGLPGLASKGVLLSRRRGGTAPLRVGRGLLYMRGGPGARDANVAAELVFESPEARLSFDASRVRGFVDNFNAFSEFDYEGERWRAEFGGGNAAKWVHALDPATGIASAAGTEGTEGSAA